MVVVDAKDLIVGRMATYVAKMALLGDKVDVVNCEKAVITGSKPQVFSRFKQKRDMGIPLKGPYFHRSPDRLVRRIIRGMLPYKQPRGRDAFKRVMCYVGFPERLKQKDEKPLTFESANVSKVPNFKYVRISEISKFLGSKNYSADD